MKGFRDANDDCGAVMEAAEALCIREYDFFRLAFRRWCGHEAEAKNLERAFVAYMFHHRVPHWVRHLGREVLSRARNGTLAPIAIDARRYRRREKAPRLGGVKGGVAGTLALLVYALVLFSFITLKPAAGPPCPGATGSPLFEAWVYTIAGKVPPPCGADEGRR